MRRWKILFLCLASLPGCSDLGTGWWEGGIEYDLPYVGWTEYDLPYAQIYLPPGVVRRTSVAALPENPEFSGDVDNQHIQVQFCLYQEPLESYYRNYQEQTITLGGKRTVLFRGTGSFHMYDSHFSTIVGIRAYFNPQGGSIAVVVSIPGAAANEIAEAILKSMHPQPKNTGLPL